MDQSEMLSEDAVCDVCGAPATRARWCGPVIKQYVRDDDDPDSANGWLLEDWDNVFGDMGTYDYACDDCQLP
jgi:hypothetical protein